MSCSLWEYDDPSDVLANAAPETYLTVVASDTLFPVESADSSWYYIIGLDSIPIQSPDTLTDAFATVTTSRQILHWWGEDSDGEVIGYQYKWNSDDDWTYTTRESGIFYVPIRTALDVFWFDIKAIDNTAHWDYASAATAVDDSSDVEYISDVGTTINVLDSADVFLYEGVVPGIQTPMDAPLRPLLENELFNLPPTETEGAVDLSPSKLVFPIKNSTPEISFRYQSNPTKVEVFGDTTFTFPTRTFVWDLYDLDGLETIINIYYAVDDTCDTCWNTLNASAYASYTLTDLEPGFHTIYLKTSDIAGAESKIIQFPNSLNTDEPDFWKVMPVEGNLLLVDDYPLDSQNNTNRWYKSILDSVAGKGNYSAWEIGERLPFSTVDITANLKYFDHVIWYTAYTGNETYREAESNINSFVLGGGNLFMIASELTDTDSTFSWFPLKDTYVVNPNGRMWPGRILESGISSEYDIAVAKMIAIRLRAFEPDSTLFAEYQELFHLQDPTPLDQWVGNPVMAGMGRFQVSATRRSGLAGLMTITLHDGYDSTLEEAGIIKFFDYLINETFVQ